MSAPPATSSTRPSAAPTASLAPTPTAAASSGLASGKDAAVAAAMDAWTAATTPEQECAAVSSAFALFLGQGSPAGCPAHVDDAVGPLHDKTVRITGISYQSGQAVLTARSADPASTGTRRRNTYYFVQEQGTWKLNSIGKRMDADVPPPPAPPGR